VNERNAMGNAAGNLKGYAERLKKELLRDKKKTIVLALLALVCLFVIGRLVLGGGSTPSSAGADVSTTVTQETPAGDEPPGYRAAPVDRSARMARWADYLANMDRSIQRDLFKPNLACFAPKPGAEPAVEDGAEQTGWFGKVLERIMQKQADSSDELLRIRQIRTEAGELTLQTTMLGDNPTALINGRVLRKGEEIRGFRVDEIAPNRCIVSKDGVRILLQMK